MLDSKVWTPTSPVSTNAYTISTIPYTPIINGASGASLMWANTLTATTWPYNAGTLTVDPVLPGVTGYFLVTSLPVACSNNPLIGSSDTTFITGVSSSVSAVAVDDICSAGIGSVTANPTSGFAPYTYNWTTLGGATTQTVNGVFAGVHTVVMTDSLGCSSTANVFVGDIPAAFQGSTTLVSCPGGNDGTAFAEMVPVLGTLTYLWDDPAAQTTQTAVGLTAGVYNCTVTSTIGCSGLVTVIVTEIPGMIGAIVNQTDPICNGGSDGMIQVNVVDGTAPYTYSWDNSTSTTNTANDLIVGPHTVTVTDDNGCVITISGNLGQPPSLSINTITPDTQICKEAEIVLDATGIGGSSPYTFTWFENGVEIGVGSSITVDPNVTNTQYCVVLSEECGSPTAQACVLIYFPTDIIPMVTPDEVEKCLPGYFEFTNTSGNAGEIATSYFEFGDGIGNALEVGTNSAWYTYGAVGTYDVTLTTTSIYGCVYTNTMYDLVQVMPNPTADFTFSVNPSDIYNVDIDLQDRSSSDVVAWDWYSAFSNPSTSILENPGFNFPQVVGVYPVTLIVMTANGCLDTVTLNMNIRQDLLVFAPNSFTPNDDEHNQVWKAEFQGIDIYAFELLIFNRWGEIIWQSNDPSVGWDGTYNGKFVKGGTYTWRAKVKDLYTDEKKEFNGAINLLK
ncbi:MAG: gliding motility-associated-like protein [Crocinitomicaceae bacterium]